MQALIRITTNKGKFIQIQLNENRDHAKIWVTGAKILILPQNRADTISYTQQLFNLLLHIFKKEREFFKHSFEVGYNDAK